MADAEIGHHLYRFPGGLKLRHHKQIACRDPLTKIPMPERLRLPLVQHQGPAGECLVEPGERVVGGQALTRARTDREVPIHAPTSGTIEAIEPGPVSWPPGESAPCIVLIPDGRDCFEPLQPGLDWTTVSSAELVEQLRAGGLTGLGGAMFPTAAKLRGEFPPIRALILNGSECEPYISCDEMLMRTRPDAIVEGACMLARATGAEEIVIGIEDQMGEVRKRLETAIRNLDLDAGFGIPIRVVQVTTIYPEGGEKQLIQVLTGQEVPHDGLPQDLGLVCLNVATAAAARDILIEGRPVIDRIVTVSGPGIVHPRNFVVPLGTPIADLIRAAEGTTGVLERLILGGPMSGLPLASEQVPVAKGSNCILALRPEDTARDQPVMPCINCGECVRVCPASLLPQTLYKHIVGDDFETARELNLFDCIECGCCAHVCPSHIPLVDHYRHGKGVLRERGIEDARAARAKVLYEAREQRLAEREAARKRKREARERKLKDSGRAKNEVQAAIERARARAAQDRDSGGERRVNLSLAGAPHLPPINTVGSIMRQVLYALVPAIAAHVVYFGVGILFQIALAVGFALALEAAMLKLRNRPLAPFLSDYSAVVTAVLFALCLPPLAPWWVALTGMVFAIVIAKQLYGGLGSNLFNPAMVGFAAVIIAFPIELSEWLAPRSLSPGLPGFTETAIAIFTGQLPTTMSWDAVSQATPLDSLRTGVAENRFVNEIRESPIFGDFGGLGWEWIANFYLLGGLYLIWRRVISWHIPVAVIATTILVSTPLWLLGPDIHPSPLQHVFSGALVMAAFFIATDPVSGCSTMRGRLVFGAGVAVLTLAIRRFGGYPDGVAFAVLMMNMAAPMIDRLTRPRTYGHGLGRNAP